MEYTVVGKKFWIGIFHASLISVPLWLLIYYAFRLVF